jgi:hypothetical protein
MYIRRLLFGLSVLAFSLIALSQTLDWTGDMTVFGTSGNEAFPAMSARPGSMRLRAFCILDGTTLCMKTSTSGGADWSTCSTLLSSLEHPRIEAAADRQYDYAMFTDSAASAKTLFRFAAGQNDWQAATQHVIAPGCTGNVLCAAMMSDAAVLPGDTNLNMTWLEKQPQTNNYSLWFAQSRDQGENFLQERQILAFDSPEAQPERLGIALSWSGSTERLIVAAPIDRAGSIPEEIRVFTSDDQGMTWGDSTRIDDMAYAQRDVSLAAYANMVMLVYSRRINAGAQRDIFMSYSPDGGLDFSPPLAVTDSMADEHDAHAVISGDGTTFSIVYLADNAGEDAPATVYLRQCAVAIPWEIESPMMISEPGSAVRDGGLCVITASSGAAVAWTSRFPTGDTDVKFDAAWRGMDVPVQHTSLPTQILLGQNYPNPFNGTTILPLSLAQGQSIMLFVSDVMGRSVMSRSLGLLGAGAYRIPLDMSALPSGVYWLHLKGVAGTRRVVLLK